MIYIDLRGKCVVCGKVGADLHHWKSRKSGGPDEDWNLIKICRTHHTEIHKIGPQTFSEKYPSVKKWLIDNGWERCPVSQRWIHCKSIS